MVPRCLWRKRGMQLGAWFPGKEQPIDADLQSGKGEI
jgi:hypothetical protein